MSSYRISLGGDKSTKRKTWETHEGMWVSHVFYQASTAVRAAPGVSRGKPFSAPAGVSSCPVGIDAPTPAWEQGLQPYGALYCFGWRSEGDWGERREAGIQWIQPPKAVSAPEFRQTTSGAHGSAGRADCLPRGKPPVRPQAQTPAPVGPDAPTPARGKGLQPYGALYCFGWRSEGGAGRRAESPPACVNKR